MLCAKGYSQINAKVNLQIAPIAVIAFILGAINGGIVGVSIAVALVLGIGWTLYWWRVGCRTLNWEMTQFIAPCFLAIFIALLSIAVSYTLPLIFKPITFMILYTLSIKLLKPKQFDRYQAVIVKGIEKIR
jgi:hypothetical protein